METEKQETSEKTVQETTSVSERSETSVAEKTTHNTRMIVGAIVLTCFIIGTAYYFGVEKKSTDDELPAVSVIAPETVRAIVNGEEITQGILDTRLQEAAQTLVAQGIDLTNPEVRTQIEDQILNDTIGYYVLKQSAAEAGASASQDDISTAYNEYVTQSGGEETLATQLQAINLTPEEFKKRIGEQLTLDGYIADNVDFSRITVTDEDVQAFYDNAVSSLGDGAPALDDVRTQIEQQLTNQQKQTLTQTFIESLREKASVEIK